MKPKLLIYLILLSLILIAAWIASRRNYWDEARKNPELRNKKTGPHDRNRGFDRSVSYIEYTKHAKCRMACRKISREEVEDIMKNGTINYKKSNVKDKPCPTYALEGRTEADDQHVRIIFAQCDFKTKVVTCIDLDREYACDCN